MISGKFKKVFKKKTVNRFGTGFKNLKKVFEKCFNINNIKNINNRKISKSQTEELFLPRLLPK